MKKIKHTVTQEDIDNNPDLGLVIDQEVELKKNVTKSGENKGILFLAEEGDEEGEDEDEAENDESGAKYYNGVEIRGEIADVDVQGVAYKQFITVNGVSHKIHADEAATSITNEITPAE